MPPSTIQTKAAEGIDLLLGIVSASPPAGVSAEEISATIERNRPELEMALAALLERLIPKPKPNAATMLRSTGERRVLNYSVEIQGVFGRNRKPKFHLEPIAKHVDPDKPRSLGELMPLMKATIRKLGVKSGARVSLREEPVSLTTYGDGTTTEVFTLLSHRYLHREVIP